MKIENRAKVEKLIKAHKQYEGFLNATFYSNKVNSITIELKDKPKFILMGSELYSNKLITMFNSNIRKLLLEIEMELEEL